MKWRISMYMLNLIKVDIQFEYLHSLRYSFGYKSSTKQKTVKLKSAEHKDLVDFKGLRMFYGYWSGIHSWYFPVINKVTKACPG